MLLSAVAVVLGCAVVARSGAPPVGSAVYVVRPDLRLCPSPMCGGYWVALANHARTKCADGLRRPACYVAKVVDEDRRPLETGIPRGALARADVEETTYQGIGKLGVLVAADVFSSAGRGPRSGRFFRLVDTGVRCIRAPCFSIRASLINRSSRTTVSGIQSVGGVVPERLVKRVETALDTKSGVLAQGRMAPSFDGGREFLATRFFLRSER